MARGTAISLVAFCFMGGGGVCTAIGGRIITPFGYANFYAVYGLILPGLIVVAMMVVRETRTWIPVVSEREMQVSPVRERHS